MAENNDPQPPNNINGGLESLLRLLSGWMDEHQSLHYATYGLEIAKWADSHVPGCGLKDRLWDRMWFTVTTNLKQKMHEIIMEDLSEDKIKSIVTIMQDILAALKSLEVKGVLHRDIEPQGILLGHDGAWKIGFPSRPPGIDPEDRRLFKLVKLGGKSSACMAPEVEGPYIYKAPELINDENGSETMDVYSAGVILCELITGGCRPKTVESEDGFFELLVEETFESVDDLLSDRKLSDMTLVVRCLLALLRELCENMLRGDPAERISATDALSELDRIAAESWPIVVDNESEE